MNPSIAAAVYTAAAICAARGSLVGLKPTKAVTSGLIAWLATALAIFFVQEPGLVMVSAAVIFALLAPADRTERVGFFLIVVPCLPIYLMSAIPFPGINYLLLITPYKVCSLVILVPILFYKDGNDARAYALSPLDAAVISVVVLMTVLYGATAGVVGFLRFSIDQFLTFLVPYFVISRSIQTADHVKKCYEALLIAALVLAFVALAATAKQWDFYRLHEPTSVFTIPDIRNGLIRISATLNTHSLGFALAIGILAVEAVKRKLALGFVRRWAARLILGAGLYVTQSRGAAVGLVVAMLVLAGQRLKSRALRMSYWITLGLCGLFGAIRLVTADTAAIDEQGTFAYRQILLTKSIEYIIEHPILGNVDFILDPHFASLRQGQNIIDITNLYLQIALQFGLVTLSVFCALFIVSFFKLSSSAIRRFRLADDPLANFSAVTAASIVGWLLLVSTTSNVGIVVHIGIVLLALGRALAHLTHDQPALERASVSLHRPRKRSLASPLLDGPRTTRHLGEARS